MTPSVHPNQTGLAVRGLGLIGGFRAETGLTLEPGPP
jgi:hypothetical protein